MRNREKLAIGALAGAGLVLGVRAWRRSRRRIDLRDRVVVITGASSGHGLILARQAAEKGARLVIAARDEAGLRAAEPELLRAGAAGVLSVVTDVREEAECRRLVEQAVERHGRIDVLINNAGIISVGPLDAMSLDDFHDAMDTNYWGAVQTTFAALPYMKRQKFGRIGNVVSIGGKIAAPHMLPYTTSKFALSGFTEGLRAELAPQNIFVTGLYPSTMRTGGHTHALFKGNREAEYSWFGLSDSIPGLASSAEHVASSFWAGVCAGDAEVWVGWPNWVATVLQNFFPNDTAELRAAVASFLPGPAGAGHDQAAVRGEALSGVAANLLNRMVPPATRPGTD